MSASSQNLLEEALRYHARGWSIIPTGHGKKPIVKWRTFGDVRASEDTVRCWFEDKSVTGIGVIFGAVSGGLASRDFDMPDSYFAWAAEYPKLAMKLPTVQTWRGFHVYFRSNRETFRKFEDGEYRGTKGQQSLLPPSLHPKGVTYEWKIPLSDSAPLLIDPSEHGLLVHIPKINRENRENRDDCVDSVISVDSVCSVAWTDDLAATIPVRAGQRNEMLFRLARILRGRPITDRANARHFNEVLREWHRRALPHITTKSFDETRIDFERAWLCVRFPMGSSPTEKLLERAKTMTVREAENYDSEGVKRLATVCAILQSAAGNANVFFLSCRTAATVLEEKDHTSTWRWMTLLQSDGLLVEVEKGTKTRATRWRWTGSAPFAKHPTDRCERSNAVC